MNGAKIQIEIYFSPSLTAFEVAEAVEVLEKNGAFYPELAGELELNQQCYNRLRRQFNSDCLLEHLKKNSRRQTRKIWIVDCDLYTAGFNFVFGQAELSGEAAIVSTARLKSGTDSDEIYMKRLRTEVVHEVMHLAGMEHCPNPYCVMYFSSNISDTDRKGEELCAVCAEKFNRRFKGTE